MCKYLVWFSLNNLQRFYTLYQTIWTCCPYILSHVADFAKCASSFLTSQREGGRTHRSRVSAHERRWLYFWGIQVRESAPASGAPRAHFYPSAPAPAPCFLPIPALSGWAGALHSLPPSQPLQLTNNWPRITNSGNKKMKEKKKMKWTSTIPKHKIFVLGCWDVLLVLDFLVCGCAWYDIVVSFEKQDSSGSRDLWVWVLI